MTKTMWKQKENIRLQFQKDSEWMSRRRALLKVVKRVIKMRLT